ncbi:MAG: GAF domain-containing protein [Moraxellaceae bacterium]|nr:MAG: GAF domain-containing protein [Moraxellaceae bacterium]
MLQDERFNREIDLQTGYRTKALLCMPIKDSSGDVIGVAQVINKLNCERFTENDEKVHDQRMLKIPFEPI